MNILKKILNIILNVVICILIILIVFVSIYLIQTKIMKRKYSNILGYTFFEVITGSMSNTINIGDYVLVKITNEDIKINDIIVFEKDNNFITHRVINIKENQIITKGDANNIEDTPIKKNQVIGKVKYIIPKVGVIKRIVNDPFILFCIIIITVISTILIFVKF